MLVAAGTSLEGKRARADFTRWPPPRAPSGGICRALFDYGKTFYSIFASPRKVKERAAMMQSERVATGIATIFHCADSSHSMIFAYQGSSKRFDDNAILASMSAVSMIFLRD